MKDGDKSALEAANAIAKILEPLDHKDRVRVLKAVATLLSIDL